jgi:uracil permease
MNENGLIVGINEKPNSIGKWIILSLQHVFAMFGATVLVPLLTGLNVGVALVASGIGTLIYILCTKGKVPVYLGSSFAYIGAIITAATAAGFTSAYVGLMVVGVVYMIVAGIITLAGSGWLKKLLPPVVIGPMIIIIGLSLAPVAVEQSGFLRSGTSTLFYPHVDPTTLAWAVPLVAVLTFLAVVGISMFAKGFMKIVPFIIAVAVGYGFSAIFGLVDWSLFENIKFFQIPQFTFLGTYSLNWSAALLFAPIALVTIAEHIGDHSVLGQICEKDFITDPGLHRTLLGDGIATFVAGAIGGPANTTYGENTGVVALTRVGSVWVTGLAAVFAIILGFVGPIQAFIMSIPWAVIGGMTLVLYGLIAGNGVKVLIKDKTDLGDMKNLIIISVMLVIGLGGALLSLGTLEITGMSLAAIVGITLNQILPNKK